MGKWIFQDGKSRPNSIFSIEQVYSTSEVYHLCTKGSCQMCGNALGLYGHDRLYFIKFSRPQLCRSGEEGPTKGSSLYICRDCLQKTQDEISEILDRTGSPKPKKDET